MTDFAGSLEVIAEQVAGCRACRLATTRTRTVPGVGPSRVKLMLIGEAPGAQEDETGLPFVGRAGQLLDKILASVGFSRDDVFITNILKCRPPGNRDPEPDERAACTPFLEAQIRLLRPSLIGALGRIAAGYLLGRDVKITRERGQWFEYRPGIRLMPLYHPSYLLRNASSKVGSPKWEMWQDIRAIRNACDQS